MYKGLLKPLLFQMDAERAHELAVAAARKIQRHKWMLSLVSSLYANNTRNSEVVAAGIRFPNPVGLAAGFDKNGLLIPFMQHLGFGFVEVGSITAKAVSGKPKPRVFRLPADSALINRMGLNNHGAETIVNRLAKTDRTIPVGVNIAKSPLPGLSGDDAVADYLASFNLALPVADYIMVNISCPNTGDGKSFEDPHSFTVLMDAIQKARENNEKPVFVKFSADTPLNALSRLVRIAEGFEVDGYAAVNTSTDRSGLLTTQKKLGRIGAGGLSGKPVAEKAMERLEAIRDTIGGQKPVISIGGIMTPEDALNRLENGATLIQVYTGFVYNGPSFPGQIVKQIQV